MDLKELERLVDEYFATVSDEELEADLKASGAEYYSQNERPIITLMEPPEVYTELVWREFDVWYGAIGVPEHGWGVVGPFGSEEDVRTCIGEESEKIKGRLGL